MCHAMTPLVSMRCASSDLAQAGDVGGPIELPLVFCQVAHETPAAARKHVLSKTPWFLLVCVNGAVAVLVQVAGPNLKLHGPYYMGNQ